MNVKVDVCVMDDENNHHTSIEINVKNTFYNERSRDSENILLVLLSMKL